MQELRYYTKHKRNKVNNYEFAQEEFNNKINYSENPIKEKASINTNNNPEEDIIDPRNRNYKNSNENYRHAIEKNADEDHKELSQSFKNNNNFKKNNDFDNNKNNENMKLSDNRSYRSHISNFSKNNYNNVNSHEDNYSVEMNKNLSKSKYGFINEQKTYASNENIKISDSVSSVYNFNTENYRNGYNNHNHNLNANYNEDGLDNYKTNKVFLINLSLNFYLLKK